MKILKIFMRWGGGICSTSCFHNALDKLAQHQFTCIKRGTMTQLAYIYLYCIYFYIDGKHVKTTHKQNAQCSGITKYVSKQTGS